MNEFITKDEYKKIIRAGIDGVKHQGGFDGLNGFDGACFESNSVDDLLDALKQRSADRADCEAWDITATQWRENIRRSLEMMAWEYEQEYME